MNEPESSASLVMVSGEEHRIGANYVFASEGQALFPAEAKLFNGEDGKPMRTGTLTLRLTLDRPAPYRIISGDPAVKVANESSYQWRKPISQQNTLTVSFGFPGAESKHKIPFQVESWFDGPIAVWENGRLTKGEPDQIQLVDALHYKLYGITLPKGVKYHQLGALVTLRNGKQVARQIAWRDNPNSAGVTTGFPEYWIETTHIAEGDIVRMELFTFTEKAFNLNITLPS